MIGGLVAKRRGSDDIKEAMKDAIKEWLDKQFMIFGRWSMASIGALTLAALLYLILWSNGWKHG